MYEKGQFMLYPNFPDKMVLSTSHLLQGEHNTPKKQWYDLPLLPSKMTGKQRAAFDSLPDLHEMKAYDVMFTEVGGFTEIPNYHVQ